MRLESAGLKSRDPGVTVELNSAKSEKSSASIFGADVTGFDRVESKKRKCRAY